MQLKESQIRKITRKVLQELFTRKSGLSLSKFLPGSDKDIDIYSYGGGDEGDDFDGLDLGETEEKIEEEDNIEED